MKRRQDVQHSIRNCSTCQGQKGDVFAPFDGGWPELPDPHRKAVLFISEAPPTDGGFWTIQPRGAKQDDLREKLLPFLDLSPSGSDRGLAAFVRSGYYLLQSFPRPLRGRLAGIGVVIPVQTEIQVYEQQARRDVGGFTESWAFLDSRFRGNDKGGAGMTRGMRDDKGDTE